MVELVPVHEMAKPNLADMLIEATGLSMAFGERQVLDRVDIWVKRNEIVTLIRPNGAGKLRSCGGCSDCRRRTAGRSSGLLN